MHVVTPYKQPKQEDTKAEHSKDENERFTIKGSNFFHNPVDHITCFRNLDPLLYWKPPKGVTNPGELSSELCLNQPCLNLTFKKLSL